MKKVVKIVVGIIVVLVVLVLALVLTLPLTIGPVVKQAAAVGGPKALGVPVAVGDVKFNPFAGRLVISKVKVGNPQGYSDKDAFAVDNLEVALSVKSLTSDTIVVKKIQIDAPAISYETKNKVSNFDAMMANAKKASEESQKEKETGGKRGDKSSKKIIIEEFTLNDAKIAYASGMTLGKSLTIPLPSVTVRDIGKGAESEGGATPAEAATAILNGVMGGISKAVTGAIGSAGDLLKGTGGAVAEGGEAAGKLIKGLGSSADEAASDATAAAKDVAGAAKDAAKDATKSLKKLNPFK